MKISRLFVLLLPLLLIASVFTNAKAEEKSSLLMLPTASKTIYLLYHKISGMSFNSVEAITASDAYKAAPPAKQAAMLSTGKMELDNEYAALDASRNVIVIRTAVTARALLSPRPSLKITIDSADRPPSSIYFPYSWAGMNFAVVPDKLEPFLDIPLKITEATAAVAKIRDNSATMVIEMIPLKADPQLLLLDGIQQQLLSAKIVAVSYYNQNMQTIWSWQTADYRRPGSESPLLEFKK